MKGLVNSTFVSIFHLASMKNCHQNMFLLESFNNEWNSQMNPNFCFVQQIYRIHAFQAVYHSKSVLFLGHLLVAVCSIEKVAFALHATFSVIMTAYTYRVAINPAEICTNRRKKDGNVEIRLHVLRMYVRLRVFAGICLLNSHTNKTFE